MSYSLGFSILGSEGSFHQEHALIRAISRLVEIMG